MRDPGSRHAVAGPAGWREPTTQTVPSGAAAKSMSTGTIATVGQNSRGTSP
ncbi:hypothetical protein [Nonomuraea sp. SYSU D8015]|uniref:hypothetical protein n=1 Tax=Nonomuraea sp. SYSU D8015 TaxID=2593644 RepID=UPI00166174A8|nr:hypothetical protein [Nonomuraea sp. SYSU D8015]